MRAKSSSDLHVFDDSSVERHFFCPGKLYDSSICLAEATIDTARPLNESRRFQYCPELRSRSSLPIVFDAELVESLRPTLEPAVLSRPLSEDIFRTEAALPRYAVSADFNLPGDSSVEHRFFRPGKSHDNGICLAEVTIDTTHPLNEPHRFQNRTICVNQSAVESATPCIETEPGVLLERSPDVPAHFRYVEVSSPQGTLVSFYYQNTRGLRTKVEDFYVAAYDAESDVIVLTETWLNDEILSSQLFSQRYTVYRKDRDSIRSGKSRGGGVLIAVSNRLTSSRCTVRVDDDIEQLWINVNRDGRKIHIGVAYVPPDLAGEVTVIGRLINSIEAVVNSSAMSDVHMMFGDFNQPGLTWSNSGAANFMFPDPHKSRFSTSSVAFLDGLTLLNFKQLNAIRNVNGRTLDLLFVDEEVALCCKLSESVEPLSRVDPQHPPFIATLFCNAPTHFEDLDDNREFDFKKADFDSLNEAISAVDWSQLYETTNVNEAVEYLITTLTQLFPMYVPASRPRQKPPWANGTLRKLKRLRATALRRFSRHQNPFTQRVFAIASTRYKSYNRALYARYVRRTQSNLKCNPKRFWAFVNEKRSETGLPSSMFLDKESADTIDGICNLFAKHFSSVFDGEIVSNQQVESALRNVPTDVLNFRVGQFSNKDVEVAISGIKTSSAAGPDGIPTIVLKRCARTLCEPLRFICNSSLSQSMFPDRWKNSIMFPVFKKGEKRSISNYRGITSLSAGSKLLETLVSRQLMQAVKPYISTDQHGFFPGRSISTNLVQFTSHCIVSMGEGLQVDTIYTDLKSAFDRVNHKILIAKLDRLGAPTSFVKWIASYLVNRRLCVKLGSHESNTFRNLSGVPQGSNLGPLLFSIFYNDVCFIIPNGCRLLYADDLKIFLLVRSIEDCRQLQWMIDLFASWCFANRMIISVKKCAVISFTRKKHPLHWRYTIEDEEIERVSTFKDLGVLLDTQLSFREHYSYIVAKSNRNLGFIFRISKEFTDPYCLRALYFSLVRSILETASVVWSPYHDVWIKRIEAVQKKFIRYALRFLPWNNPNELPSYESRCELIGMKTLEKRRDVAKAVFVGKLLLGEIDAAQILYRINMNVVPRNLRLRRFLRLEFHRTDYAQNEPIRGMCLVFNEVFDQFDFNVNINVFRNRLYLSNV